MNKFNYLNFLLILILSLSISNSNYAENKDGAGKNNKPHFQKTLLDPAQSVVDINNITTWVGQDGYHDWLVGGSWAGAFPNGVNAGAIFSEGIVWGGIVNDGTSPTVRVNGNTYSSGCSAISRLYRVRPDYATGNLNQDAADFLNISVGAVSESDVQGLRDQYQKDWNEWPGNDGAPYQDVDGNGTYDPTVDIPGVPGASQSLFIKYNDDLSSSLYGAPPIGLEISETYWSYAYTGALGNVIYKKVDMVYKGTPTSAANSNIQDMYIVQWADPDVGNSTDDFAGCDTALNLGYAYSSQATDAVYDAFGLAPPAIGYDFLQGVSKYTGNPNDSAIFNLQWRHGYKYVNRKPMSSYAYFAAGGAWQDPVFTYTGTLEFYNLMRGFKPDPPYPNSEPFPESVADVTPDGTFLLTGDPVAGTGKLDGSVDGPGDRRIMVTNGPITMNLGDTAEVVLAMVGGLGTDNLSSITQMKTNDATAQTVFDILFKLPSIPPPDVQVANLNEEIVLNWGSNQANIDQIESFSGLGYNFEGYEVYQLPTASSTIENGVLLGVFDLVDGVTAIYDTVNDANGTKVPVLSVDGKDAGVQRFLTITTDKIKNVALHNGQEYYFAVVPYAYNPTPLLPFHALRSAVVIHTAIPQLPVPGTVYNGIVGDTLEVTHTGPSDGFVVPIVVDPTRVNGHSYAVNFDTTGGQTTWSVVDQTANTTVVSGLTNQSGDQAYPIVDGVIVKVIGPPEGVKPGDDGWAIPAGTRRFTFSNADIATGFGLPDLFATFSGALGWASPYEVFGGGPPGVPSTQLDNVLLKLATVTDADVLFDPTFNPNDENMSFGYRYGRHFTDPPADPRFAPHIIDATSPGYSFQDFTKNMPMSAWNVEDPANPQRIVLGWMENNVADGLVDGKYWPSDASLDNVASSGPREWLWIYKTTYSETPDPAFEVAADGNPLPIMYWASWNRRGAVPFSPGASGEDQFAIFHTNINYITDVFSFTAPTKEENNNSLAKENVKSINVFPNPYYGYQYRETSRDAHYVTFSHLPTKATLRIFDLSGVQVKTINHASASQFDKWNLQNEQGYPVASGIYVVYIDMPDLGTTKILKLAVIMEQQILQVY